MRRFGPYCPDLGPCFLGLGAVMMMSRGRALMPRCAAVPFPTARRWLCECGREERRRAGVPPRDADRGMGNGGRGRGDDRGVRVCGGTSIPRRTLRWSSRELAADSIQCGPMCARVRGDGQRRAMRLPFVSRGGGAGAGVLSFGVGRECGWGWGWELMPWKGVSLSRRKGVCGRV